MANHKSRERDAVKARRRYLNSTPIFSFYLLTHRRCRRHISRNSLCAHSARSIFFARITIFFVHFALGFVDGGFWFYFIFRAGLVCHFALRMCKYFYVIRSFAGAELITAIGSDTNTNSILVWCLNNSEIRLHRSPFQLRKNRRRNRANSEAAQEDWKVFIRFSW